jgi:alkylation response protein AidB-like acyl-CoA dehydrogenase
MTYKAPVEDILFALEEVVAIDQLKADGAFPELSPDLTRAILEEAAKLAENVLAPLNRVGDKEGARIGNDGVKTATGFAEAYAQFRDGGWQGIGFSEEWGGQGMPKPVALAVQEMIHSANMAFGLCPMLTFGAIEALTAHGSDELKALYLPKLVTGQWTGTMNLTEPQAGSDVGALRSKAEPMPDGTYRIRGQKIYITWGDHDVAENIVHLVLARIPGAPEGSGGVSLFLVPKFIPDAYGRPGKRNDLRAIGLEKKLGIHASPTCTMAFGEQDGAVGWLIGEENKGMACMFTMMNSARLNVGLQGVAIAERAFQQALRYAEERRQGRAPGAPRGLGPSAIIDHPDIRQTLMRMKSAIDAGRIICYATALAADEAQIAIDPEDRAYAKRREEILTPISKAWCTDRAIEITSAGVQIHGGMGFVEETGAAQHLRDSRIAAIYEGTNGIQALDLVGRKLSMQNGLAFDELIEDMRETLDDLATSSNEKLPMIARRLAVAVDALEEAGHWMRETLPVDQRGALAGATSFLKLAGDVTAGWMLARGALAAQRLIKEGEGASVEADLRIRLARFFAETVLAVAPGLVAEVKVGADLVFGETLNPA